MVNTTTPASLQHPPPAHTGDGMSANYLSTPSQKVCQPDSMKRSDRQMPEQYLAVGPGFYAVLSVPADASTQAITKSYEALVKKAKTENLAYDEPNTDTKQAKEDHLKELYEAMKVLSDPRAREWYDGAIFGQNANTAPIPPFYRPRRASRDRSLSPGTRNLNTMQVRYPDVWIAERDGRIRTDGRRWRDPPDRSGSRHRRRASSPMPTRQYRDEYRPGGYIFERHNRDEYRPGGEAEHELCRQGRRSPNYAPFRSET